MRRAVIATALAVLLLAGFAAGCGAADDHATDVVEGEPLELGELTYRVELTRFLNPDDIEDAEYLVGQEPPPSGQNYLGVFVTVRNDSDDQTLASARSYAITDLREGEHRPISIESPYALEIGADVPPNGRLPTPDSSAAIGPARGGLLLFLVDDIVIDSRPLILEIEDESGTGDVQLDI